MSGVCQVNVADRRRPGRFTGLSCGEPATVRIEFGCVHEHVKAEDVCDRHADRVAKALDDGDLVCSDCWAAGHPCAVVGRVAVPGGAA